MQYRHLRKGANTSDDAATSRKNLVNFGAVIPEITFLIGEHLCGYWAKSSRRYPFIALAFPNALEISMVAFKAETVSFYPVLLQIIQLNCVQQASISTVVNSRAFTRGQHVCVSPLLARGDTAMPGGLYAGLCHEFLVSFLINSMSQIISGSTGPIFTIFFHHT